MIIYLTPTPVGNNLNPNIKRGGQQSKYLPAIGSPDKQTKPHKEETGKVTRKDIKSPDNPEKTMSGS